MYSSAFYPSIGGIENFVFLLARELVKLGHYVTVFTEVEKVGEKKFPFKVIRSNSLEKKIKTFKKHDIVLMNNISLTGVPAALLSGTKLFIVHHSAYHKLNNFSWREHVKSKMCLFFNNIAVSQFVANAIWGHSKIIYNMYDDYTFKRKNAQKSKNFIFCGRLVSDKGADVLIDAFSLVLKKYKKSNLTIVGDGPEYKILKEKSKELGIQKNIQFVGALTGTILNKKLNEHYCMIVPSLWNEPFGIVALEGLATTEFVISSNKGGLPEAVKNCGQLVKPTPVKLAQSMIGFLRHKKNMNNDKKRKHLKKCKLHLSNHSCKYVAKKYSDYFQKQIS